MNHIREEAPVSRTDLAKATGLNKATVSSLVNQLIEDKFVHEVGIRSGNIGRPRVMLSNNPKAGYIISAEIGVDFILVIASDFEPKPIYQVFEENPPNENAEVVIGKLIKIIQRAIDYCKENDGGRLLGLAVGLPGLVDYPEGKLLFAPNLNWRDVPIKNILQDYFKDILIVVDNEANMAALGEYFFGSANKVQEVLYISAGIGLGGGILRQGSLVRGFKGMAGEFGHIIIDPNGIQCSCGNRGCWETLVSQRALFRYVSEMINSGENSSILEKVDNDLSQLTVEMIVNAAHDGDLVALESIRKMAVQLATGVASLINVLNPELVVFGGILSSAWVYIKPVLDERLRSMALLWERQATEVVLAKHQMNACVMGGVATIYQEIFSSLPSKERRLTETIAYTV
jgi:glucokinase-like ROK family protein